jgi:DnaJ-class molecular chaperone
MNEPSQRTGVFDAQQLNQARCTHCNGTGELRIDSEDINEHFEVEKQTVITECPHCHGKGFVAAG